MISDFARRRWLQVALLLSVVLLAPPAAATSIVILPVVRFDTGHVVPIREAEGILEEVATVLRQYPKIRVAVEGHSDNRGTPEHNLELSRRRAEWVVAFLVSREVERSRLEVVAYGATRPIAPNNSPRNRAKNRRVQFMIIEGPLPSGSHHGGNAHGR
jgi:outer membrane protein OmpA-like peptidoglycan-associated protein